MPTLSHSNLSEVGDVELMFPGDRFPVWCGPDMRATGWRGGIFVQYVAGVEPFTVELSDGNMAAGFMLFPSENYTQNQPGSFGDGAEAVVGSNANYTAAQPATGQGGQNVMTIVEGGTRAYFKAFETIALAGGVRGGGVIVYSLNEDLKISENGLLCNDADAALGVAGVATVQVVGIVSAVPSTGNGGRLCLDMKY